jgi:hypothetical protein
MSWIAAGTTAVSLAGSLLKPKAKAPAQAAPIDLNAEAKKSLAGNLANESDIEKLLAQANDFTQDQNISLMEKAMPGYSKLASRFTGVANELLTNPYELPTDVAKNLERLAAERGISTGVRGQAGEFSLLRDFGVNSLSYGQSRIGQAQSITQMLASLAPKVNPLSPMSFYVTPGQQAQVAAGNQNNQQAANNAEAAAYNYNTADRWSNIVNGLTPLVGQAAGALGKKSGNLVNTEAFTNSANDD